MYYYVYILTNTYNKVLYIGVTNNLKRRLYEHQEGLIPGFSKRYNLHKIVHFEQFSEVEEAIAREKQLKGWKRERKDCLITENNPNWEDLSKMVYA